MRPITLAFCGLLAAPVSTPAAPARNYVDVQLILAVDVSRSMDFMEQQVQRDGYVAAFRSAEVQKAIASGAYGRIAVTYIEWSSADYQQVLIPWRIIGDDEDAIGFADDLAGAPLEVDRSTSISAGLAFAASAFLTSGLDSDRRTIDVSGDGPNNDGPALPLVRETLLAQGININGLPILFNPTPMLVALGPISVADYYEDCVIGGPGAFVIPIRALADFAPAIQRKLVMEIVAVQPMVVPVVDTSAERPKIDCVMAERLRGGGP
jgi:hypothetical protein